MIVERYHAPRYEQQEYSCQASYSCQEFADIATGSQYVPMNIERLRNSRGLNQEDLAEMAEVKQSTISKIENGFDGVTLRVLKKIAAALKVDVRDLFEDDRTAAEKALLKVFRSLPADRQQGWLDLAGTIATPDDPAAQQTEQDPHRS